MRGLDTLAGRQTLAAALPRAEAACSALSRVPGASPTRAATPFVFQPFRLRSSPTWLATTWASSPSRESSRFYFCVFIMVRRVPPQHGASGHAAARFARQRTGAGSVDGGDVAGCPIHPRCCRAGLPACLPATCAGPGGVIKKAGRLAGLPVPRGRALRPRRAGVIHVASATSRSRLRLRPVPLPPVCLQLQARGPRPPRHRRQRRLSLHSPEVSRLLPGWRSVRARSTRRSSGGGGTACLSASGRPALAPGP